MAQQEMKIGPPSGDTYSWEHFNFSDQEMSENVQLNNENKQAYNWSNEYGNVYGNIKFKATFTDRKFFFAVRIVGRHQLAAAIGVCLQEVQ